MSSVYMLSNKNSFGFVLGMLGNIFFFAFGVLVGSYFTPIANSVLFILNGLGLYKWSKFGESKKSI